MFKITTIPIAQNVQKTNDGIEELHSLMLEQNNVINQIGEWVDSVCDEVSVLTSRSNIPATVTTQPLTTLQQVRTESPSITTLTLLNIVVVEEEAAEEAAAVAEEEGAVAEAHRSSLEHSWI